MSYTIEILRSAQKQLDKIDYSQHTRIIDAIRDDHLVVLIVSIGNRKDVYR